MAKQIGFAVGDKATKTADGQEKPVIMQQITVSPYNRKSSNLTDWRNANKSAESLTPRRTYLYDLYNDYGTTDAQIIATWQKRVDPILSASWEFTDKDGNTVDEINELIDCIGFDDLLTTIMESKRDGYKMAEPTFFINDNEQNEFSLYVVPLKNMRPELGVIAVDQSSDNGINIREGIYAKTVMEFGKTNDLGLMLSACMYAILKRGNVSDWAEFIEIFGRGIVDATWDGFDLKQRQDLATAIKEMGGGGVIIRPVGTTIDIKNNTGNANGDLQNKFTEKMDAYISKLFLGSTETTDSSKSSGYAQSQTHQEQQDKKSETDLNFVRRNLNSRFIKILKAAGFDTKGGTFVLKQKKKLDKEAFEVHKEMAKELGVPLDDDFFYEEYGARKPDDYEKLKKEALERSNKDLAPKDAKENADTPPASKDEKVKTPNNPKEQLTDNPTFWRRVLRLFQSAPMKVGAITPMHQCGEAHTIKLASFVADKVFESIKDGLINRAYATKGEFTFDADLFNYTAKTLTAGFIQGWHTKERIKLVDVGFAYGIDDPALLTAYEMNLFRFAGVKTLYEAQQLNELFRKSKSFKEFYDTASSMLTVHNRDWLETEYNTAMAAAESAATYARLLKQVELFPFWEYKTVGDEKVRKSHELLDGIILPWNSPLWQYLMPPNDWNCRCYIVPRTKGEVTQAQLDESLKRAQNYVDSEAFKKSAKSGWGINRADKAMVFTENQHYTSDYLDANKKLNDLNVEQYGLKDLETGKATKAEPFKPKFNDSEKAEAIADFFSSTEKATARKYVLNDASNRRLVITKSTISSHTSDAVEKYRDRHIYLAELEDILKHPDEVWLNAYKTKSVNNYTYIKYYKDKAIAVVARLKDDLSLEIETWYSITDNELRHGLLIVSK